MTTEHVTAPRPTEHPFTKHEAMAAAPVAGDVVVAVGDDPLTSALRYAVAEASARSVGLHLVHVVHFPAADGTNLSEVWHDAVTRGGVLLSAAADMARQLGGPEVPVSLQLCEHGTIAGSVVELGDQAGVIVVQHRRLGRLRRVVTHSVTRAVAAHAEAVVVAVPDGWVPRPDQVGCVIVGVQDMVEARILVARAMAEAARRSLALWIVHAGSGDDSVLSGLGAILDDLRPQHPHLRVDVMAEDGSPVRLLVNPMSAGELLVLGRRHGVLPGSHLGAVARSVLDDATCPVMLVKVPRKP